MRLTQVLRIGSLALLVALAFGFVLAGVVAPGTLGAGFQPVPGKGIVYATRAERAPNGAIVKPQDLGLGVMLNIVTGLGSPHDILCGPDGRLYVNDLWQRDGRHEVNRILRFNQDGSGRTLVAQWRSNDLRPSAMVFAPNGDLYFGTVSTARDKPVKGVWRIPGALQAESSFNQPERILPPEVFSPPGEGLNSSKPSAFLTAEPFTGDLLILDGGSQGRVLRAAKPDFKTVAEFIPAFKDLETGKDFRAAGLGINSHGDILVNDFSNNKVLRYGPDGTFKGVFAKLETPNQIAIGPDDIVYVILILYLDVPLVGIHQGKAVICFTSSG